MSFNMQVPISEYIAAARSPPLSEPANKKFLRQCAYLHCRNDCTSTDRPALAVDRSAPGTCGLVSDAGGCRQQARSDPVVDSGQGRALRSVVCADPSDPRRAVKTQAHTSIALQLKSDNSEQKDSTGTDSDRSDRQRANSKYDKAHIAGIRRHPDGVSLRGYYRGPGTAMTVLNKADYRYAVCLAAECRMSVRSHWSQTN